jgi:hypothetical protein
VRRTLHHTAQRLGVRDRAQAIGWCVAQGLVSAADLRVIFQVSDGLSCCEQAQGCDLQAAWLYRTRAELCGKQSRSECR